MPVRIYDISKKLGLENKVILAKAKAMGIAAAKVPSSSLDKITAEELEKPSDRGASRNRRQTGAPPVVEPPKPAPVEEKIVFITAPPPVEPKPEPAIVETTTATAPPPVVEPPKPVAPPRRHPATAAAQTRRTENRRQGGIHPVANASGSAPSRKRRSRQTAAVAPGCSTKTRLAPAISALPRWPPGAAARARAGQTRRAGRSQD